MSRETPVAITMVASPNFANMASTQQTMAPEGLDSDANERPAIAWNIRLCSNRTERNGTSTVLCLNISWMEVKWPYEAVQR
jgi:hypothetical protein